MVSRRAVCFVVLGGGGFAIGLGAGEAEVNWVWRHQLSDFDDLSGTKTLWVSGTSYTYQRDLGGAEKRLNQNLGGYVATRIYQVSKKATQTNMDLWLDATTSRTNTNSPYWQSLLDSTVVATPEGNWQVNRLNSRPAMVFSTGQGLAVQNRQDAASLSVFLAGKFDGSPNTGSLLRLGSSSSKSWEIRVANGQFFVSTAAATSILSSTVPEGAWVVAVRLSGTQATLYVDGTSSAATIAARTGSGAKALNIADGFTGQLSLGEIRLFKRPLPDDDQKFIIDEMRASWGAK